MTNSSYFHPKYTKEIKSPKSGYIKYLSAKEVGMISFNLGAGRLSKTESIDPHAGIYLNKVINEKVNKNETLATLYSSKPIDKNLVDRFIKNVAYSNNKFKQSKTILAKLSS
jgi:pyrimidine-nucleoside phosphorylase